MLSDVLSKHIPGNPNIIVQNMPGSGGKKLANYLYNVAPNDGTYFGFLADAYVVSQLLTPNKVKYDPSKFVPIGSITPVNPVTMVGRNSPVKSVEDARNIQYATACTGTGSQSFIMPAMMKYFLEFKVKIICGYKGSAPGTLALERGEVDACLFVGSEGVKEMSAKAQAHLQRIPTITLDHPTVPSANALSPTSPSAATKIRFTTAVHGVHLPGTAYRMDEVPVPLRQVLSSDYPSDAD